MDDCTKCREILEPPHEYKNQNNDGIRFCRRRGCDILTKSGECEFYREDDGSLDNILGLK